MFEYKTLKCNPSAQESFIRMYGRASWVPNSVSEVNNTDTDVKVIGDTVYTTKTRINYVNITLQRDLKYSQDKQFVKMDLDWSRAYDQYEAASNRYDKFCSTRKPEALIVFAVFFFLVGCIMFAFENAFNIHDSTMVIISIVAGIVLLALSALFIFLFVMKCVKISKGKKLNLATKNRKVKEYTAKLVELEHYILETFK